MCKMFFLLAISCFCFSWTCLGQTKIGTTSLLSFAEPLYLEVIIEECKMVAYKKNGEELVRVAEFPVASVKKGVTEYPIGKGFITKVELNPVWIPTDATVTAMNKKLIAKGKPPKFKKGVAIKSGSSNNAMGTFKMILSHSTPKNGSIYRIHGTNAPQSIGKRTSRGCIRMNNETGFPIAQNILSRLKKGQEVEVNIIMKKS